MFNHLSHYRTRKMKSPLHISFVVILLLAIPTISLATITGPAFVVPGSTQSYSFTNGSSIVVPNWSATNGTVLSSSSSGTTYSVSVQWGSAGSASLSFLSKFSTLETYSVTVATPTVGGGGTFCGTANVTVSNSASGVSYQLYRGATADQSPKTGTGSTLTWAVTTVGTNTYTVVATPGGTVSGSAVITINQAPQLKSIGTNTSCVTAMVLLVGPEAAATYTLKRDGTTVSSLPGSGTVKWIGLATPGTYTVDAAISSCTLTMTGSLIVYPEPAAPTVPAVGRCGTGTVTITGTAGTDGNSLKWYNVSTGGTALATGLSYSPSISSTTTYYVSSYNTTSTCETSTRTPVVATVVTTTPTVSATVQSDICTGSTTAITITNPNSVPGTTFSWTYSALHATGGSDGTGSSISQTLNKLAPTGVASATYVITPTANGCSGTPVTRTFSIFWRPTATASPQSVCTGNATSIALSSDVTGATFSWPAPTLSGVTGGASGSGSTIAQTLSTSTDGSTATYSVTASSNGCAQLTPTIVVATVNKYNGGTVSVINNARWSAGDITVAGTGATTYNWFDIGGSYQGTGPNHLAANVTATNSSYGRVWGIDSHGCSASTYQVYGVVI
jgi:hypothetical protein